METGERLAAYLAGELEADEATALEADLAGDPALRSRLERIRRADAALAALPAVAPSASFSADLRSVVADEVAAQQAAPVVDELAARRLQRRAGSSRYLGAGVAAAALLVVSAIGLGQLLGGGDDSEPGTAALELSPAQDAVDPLAAFVRVTDTDYDADSVQALASQPDLMELPAQIDEPAARDLEASRYEAFGLGGDTAAGSRMGTDGGATAAGSSGTAGGSDTGGDQPFSSAQSTGPEADSAPETGIAAESGRALGSPGEEPFADVRRCLPEIVATASEPVIPLYAEVASFEGEPAIIYLVLTREPGARLFNRVEAWAVSRADCFPLLFQQVQR